MEKRLLFYIFIFLSSIVSKAQNFDWAFNIHGTSTDLAGDLLVDINGNIYVTGSFAGTADFDPGPGVFNLSSGINVGNCFIAKYDSVKNLIWAKQIGSASSFAKGNNITLDYTNNVIVSGVFTATLDVDPGPGIYNLTGSGLQSVFVVKLDSNGNFIWGSGFNATNAMWDYSLTTNQFNDVLIAGLFRDTVDFDPGNGVVNQIGTPTGSGFIVKLDSNGNYSFSKAFGANLITNLTNIYSISCDTLNNIFLSGYFSNNVDFDPGPGVNNLNANNGRGFLLKLNSYGNFIWVKQFPGGLQDFTIDLDKNFVLTGTFQGNWDFDPGLGVFNLSSSGTNDVYVLKIDSLGNFLWVFNINSSSGQIVYSITSDKDNNIYILGNVSGNIDFDHGSGISLLNLPIGDAADFVLKVDKNANYTWVQVFGSIIIGNKKSFSVDINSNIYLFGNFEDIVDFDPGPNFYYLNAGSYVDVYLLKLRNDSCSNLTLVIDSVLDVTCIQNGFASAYTLSGNSPYNYSWNTIPPTNDSVLNVNNSGIYTLTVTDNIGCTRTSTILIDSPALINQFELNVNLTPTLLNPNLTSNIYLEGFNNGCLPQTGSLTLILDSNISYLNSSPPPDVIYGDSLLWFFSNLTYGAPFTSQIQITLDSTVNLGDILCFEAQILPVSGDADTSNNVKHYCFTVVNSYDPNDKQVYPVGDCNSGLITNDKKLTYTVRFQNTGNAEAINIYILDTLSYNLDINSVKIVGKSHEPMITEIIDNHILKFRFDNIHLPDSTTNEPLSHGYVIYEINPVSGISNGSVVENSAAIFFDYNPPIITNSVINTIVDTIPTLNTQVTQISNVLIVTAVGLTYQWLDCNNNYLPIQGETGQLFVATSNGSYSVEINNLGCIDTSICFVVTTVDMEELPDINFSLFPNPASDVLNINYHLTSSSEVDIIIFNALGKKALHINSKEPSGLINHVLPISDLAEGIYYLKLQIENSVTFKKFFKVIN